MKRLKNTLILGITLYYLIPLSVMAANPGGSSCGWKRAIGCRSIHLVPMRDCFSKGQPENRLLYGISRSQCGTYRWIHDG